MAAVTVQLSTMQFSSVTWTELYKSSLLLLLYSDLALRRAVPAGPGAWLQGLYISDGSHFPGNWPPCKTNKILGTSLSVSCSLLSLRCILRPTPFLVFRWDFRGARGCCSPLTLDVNQPLLHSMGGNKGSHFGEDFKEVRRKPCCPWPSLSALCL